MAFKSSPNEQIVQSGLGTKESTCDEVYFRVNLKKLVAALKLSN